MYENFKSYWEAKKDNLEKLGITKELAHLIWCDAVDALGFKLMLNKLNK